MVVNLIQKAVFDLKEDACTAIPSTVFNTLVSGVKSTGGETPGVNVRFFKNMSDYADALAISDIGKVDTESPVYVNEKGNIFVFLND